MESGGTQGPPAEWKPGAAAPALGGICRNHTRLCSSNSAVCQRLKLDLPNWAELLPFTVIKATTRNNV